MRPLFSLSLSLLLAAHAVAGAVSGGAVCTTALDCFLNGDCVKGLCVCDAAWDGAACTVLATEPAYQLWPPVTVEPPPAQDLASSWGASIVQVPRFVAVLKFSHPSPLPVRVASVSVSVCV